VGVGLEDVQSSFYGTEGSSTYVSEDHEYACYLLQAGFLLGLFIDPEDGGDMFLRNIG
jgi:hypothetical protein